eukprot:jgi/Tetstr1/428216/TSEL_018257.t1
MMNSPLAILARQSAIKTDPGVAPPPLDFRDDNGSDDAFSLDGASDSDSSDIQHIKPAAVKPTLDLKNVPIWDNTISTRDNAKAIKIALGSAGYLDTTKGKGTRQEQMILPAALRHATAYYPMALAIVNNISMDSGNSGVRRYQNLWNLLNKAHGQWTFEYVATNYLIPGLHPDYYHVVDTTTSAATINEKLATIISAGQNMEARKRQRQQRVRACPPNLNSYNPRDPQHTTMPSVVCRRCDRPGHTQLQCAAKRHANGMRVLGYTTPTSTMNDTRYDLHQREPAERSVNTNYGHNPRDNYHHQAPPAQEGPPPPHQDERYLPRHQEGDATALPAPHSSGSAHLPSSYVDLGDYHPTLVASAIAEAVRPYPAQMAALAMPAPIVCVSTAPRKYKEAISINHPDDLKQSMDREIASITKMETFVWNSVPELRRDNPSAIIIQTALRAFAEKHDKDGNLIKREARVVVRGDQLTAAGENYGDTNTYAPIVSFIALRTTIALAL